MKKMKLLATVVLSAALLVGCSGGGGGAGGSTDTLELWMPPLAEDTKDLELWNAILEPFEKEKDVDVKVTVIPWDSYETKYLTGISSGKGPDVGYMYGEMIGDYIAKDQIVALDDKVTDEQRDNLLFLDSGVIQDKQYAMPFVVGGARVFVYNKALLKEAGVEPPTTWDEFLAASKVLKDKGIQPFLSAWGDPARGSMNGGFIPFVWQAGGDLFSEDGKKTAFDSPEAIKAAEFVKELYDEGYLPESTTGLNMQAASKEFESGKVAFYIDSEQNAPKWDKAGLDWGYVTSLKDKEAGTMIASDALVMLKGCKDQQLCYDLMSFMQEGEQMAKFHEQANFPPIGKDEKNTYDERLQPIYERDRDMLRSLPVVANGVPAYNALYKNLQQMLAGAKTPEQAMKDAAAEGNKALEQGVK